ncbi:hypothetical protein ACFL9S_08680 [Erwinia sp. AnSW2-5]|uniref:hypothetical protein n=1 Tax=Erwinia sp. AnSW2-5 TaxID=3367692 RepID=UPI00385D05BC
MRGSAGKQVLAAREVQVNVDCDDAQVMSLRFGSSDPQAFTFGRDGKLDVRLSGLTMDGRAISFLDFTRSEERNRRQQMTSLQPGSQIVTADVGRHLNFKLTLRPIFNHGLFSISDLQEISSDITVSVDD